MVSLAALGLPLLISVVAIFFASSIIWMALPIHKSDYKKLNDKESAALDALRSWNLGPGVFMFPACDPQALKDPAAAEQYKRGPWGTITLLPGPVSMGKCLGLWVFNLAVISFLIAYISSHALPAGAPFGSVFRMVASIAFLAYGGSTMTDSIWKGRPWSLFPGSLFDAVVYAAITGAAFAWMWPKA